MRLDLIRTENVSGILFVLECKFVREECKLKVIY